MTRIFSRSAAVTAYDVLGAPPAASRAALYAAYRALALALHPDRVAGQEEEFKAVALAWGLLKTEEGRRAYDAKLRSEKVLNCAACKGAGLRAGFVRGKYAKDLKCEECEGRGHHQ